MMNEGAGLYVHVPFCETKCPYCDFYSVTDLSLVSRWLGALQTEMAIYRKNLPGFDSLFIGGGTPSLLDETSLGIMLASIRTHWSLSLNSEITIEANPDDITEGRVAFYRSLGINRLSLGVQSFDEQELSFLRRRHTARGARAALESVRASFDNFSIDLIYGLPGQTEKKWLRNLEEALRFQPPHLSCYQLTVESRTPFGRMRERGDLKSLTEAWEERFFLVTSRFLEERGYAHYEISNFAKTEERECRHNLKYWDHTPYLGLGPAAHSFDNGQRWWNYRSIEKYSESLTRGKIPLEGLEALSPEQIRLERLSLGFRTKYGVSVSDLGDNTLASSNLTKLREEGLVRIRDGRVIPTTKGFLVADWLPLLFSG
jgi:oxygen-independent coproporphyrinogen-3 oxidase